tara:strand:- start:207 stop:1028 length:822 start_codon:yes stop_codon:yes gene_type:complete
MAKLSKIYKKVRLNFLYKIFKFLNNKNFRVDALIIGGQRCASTSIIDFLSNSNQIITPKNNEQLFFFSDKFDSSENYKKYHLSFVYNYFKKFNFKKKFFIEKTPEYCLKSYYLENIYKYNNDIKLIFIFREPYSRIKSTYELYKKQGYLNTFDRFLIDKNHKYNIKEFSLYSKIFKRVFDIFKIENVLIIDFKKINDDITKKEISKFLNIDLTNMVIPKSNSFKTGEENKNYVSEIKNFYNQDLDNDYKYFLELYKEYKEKFVKKINFKNVDC